MQKALIKSSEVKPVEIFIPGSKSFTNRALLIASLAKGKSVLQNPLFSDDTKLMAEALRKLGVKITKKENGDMEVTGTGGNFTDPQATLFLGNAGTGIRFISALLALVPYKVKITGDSRMKERPIKDLITALRQLGTKIESSFKNGRPPLKIKGGNLKGGTIKLSGKISSQYLSALLMISPYAENNVQINIEDELVSKPYIDMTIAIMEDFGIKVENINYKIFKIKSGQKYKSREYKIEGDASSASYFFALSAIHNVPVKVKNINPETLQADIKFLDILKKMGCKVQEKPDEISVSSTTPNLKPLGKIDLNDMPDAAMTVAIMACFAKGRTTITNIGNLRVKETDRIHALTFELKKTGVNCNEISDGIEIDGDPKNLHGDILIKTYNDHRMAMCFSVLATKINNIQILNPACTSKTYPNFFADLKKTGLNIKIREIPNIVLTGMRGSGKTMVGKAIAKLLHYRFVDTDNEIERQERMKIDRIVKEKSWFYFRKKEKYIVRKIHKQKNCVISTGGGVIIDAENEKTLKKTGIIVFLHNDLNVLTERLKKSKTPRPPLTNSASLEKEMEEIWQKRKDRYTESADLIFDATKDRHPEAKAMQILLQI